MHSFTSNSSFGWSIWKDRSVRILLITVILIGLTAFISYDKRDPSRQSSAVEDRFWVLKTHLLRTEYNMVIVGDSRVYRGFSPRAMNSVLPGYRIINIGFKSGGLSRLMLKKAESLLNPEAKTRIVILGVTPHSLTPVAEKNEHYFSIKKWSRLEALEKVYLVRLRTLFMPVSRDELVNLLTLRKESDHARLHQVFEDDGWVASWFEVPQPEAALAEYKRGFRSNQVHPDLCEDLFQIVQEWKSEGIQAFGLRPPTTRAMVALENSISGFNETQFVEGFRKAGGIWLTFNPDDYFSYDGSHLEPESARKISRDLAEKIRSYLERERGVEDTALKRVDDR